MDKNLELTQNLEVATIELAAIKREQEALKAREDEVRATVLELLSEANQSHYENRHGEVIKVRRYNVEILDRPKLMAYLEQMEKFGGKLTEFIPGALAPNKYATELLRSGHLLGAEENGVKRNWVEFLQVRKPATAEQS